MIGAGELPDWGWYAEHRCARSSSGRSATSPTILTMVPGLAVGGIYVGSALALGLLMRLRRRWPPRTGRR